LSDRQTAAYRDMAATDVVTDDDILRMIEDGELMPAPDDEPIRSPDEWRATGWDEGREPPKTLAEARAALAARVADPAAPDTDATAYDDLED
jgi:hypothetical protein